MGAEERERENEISAVSLNEIVSNIIPGEKYARIEIEEPVLQDIELEDFPQKTKKGKKYQQLITEITIETKRQENNIERGEEEEEGENAFTLEERKQNGIKGWIQKIQKIKERNNMKFAWGCVVLGLLCTAWIGPCFKLLGSYDVAPARRASWRSQVLLLLLLIPSFFEYRSLTAQQKRDLFNMKTFLQLLLCGGLWFLDLFLWSNALDFTTVSRASVFSNTSSLMIMVWSIVRRHPISGMEISGGLVGFGGIVFAVVGTNLFFASAAEIKAVSPLKGDILSVGSAASVAAYVLNATKARAKVSLFIYTLSNTFILCITLSGASFIMEDSKFDTSVNGIFGWVEPQFLIIIVLLSVVAGLIGFNLNNVALRYVPPLGYSLVTLCDPFISSTYAWIIGADGLPGVFTLLGGIITLGGIVILVIGQEKRKKKEKLQELEKDMQKEKEIEKEEIDEKEEKMPPKVVDFIVSDGTLA